MPDISNIKVWHASNYQISEARSFDIVRIRPSESLSLLFLPREYKLPQRRQLKSVLLVQAKTTESGVLATTYLETEEYGWGNSIDEALIDLIESLIEYLESLESREGQLAELAYRDLARLRALIE